MEAFLTFRKQLFYNYLFGSSLAVLGVGGVFIFLTLTLSTTEFYYMSFILVSSFISMALIEY
ncbi:MAG: hypothetical protein WB217_06860, partial [Mesobacillus sp.]